VTIFFRFKIDRIKAERNFYSLTPPPPYLKYYSFGFNESLADSLWLRYIQDLQKCRLFGHIGEKKTTCDRGWSFQMLDEITDLAPKFRMPYSVGPLSLSVLVDDYDGAGILFEKAIKAFPNDWQILYKAAYYYIYDKKDPMRAAHLLLQAQKNGGPEWLALLASKLYDRSGQLVLGITTLKSYLEQIRDPAIRKRVEHRLARLICEHDALEQGRSLESCPKESSD
jgi:hypothetical protein